VTLGDLLIRLAVFLTEQVNRYTKLGRERTMRIAENLQAIGDVLEKTASRLSTAELPKAECEELRIQFIALKEVLEPVLRSGQVEATLVARLRSELYLAIDAPIRSIELLTHSRWALLGSYREGGAPITVGTFKHEDSEIPARVSPVPDLPARLQQLSSNPAYSILIDPDRELKSQLAKIEKAAGLFRGVGKTLRARV